jgi:DNA-binding IclR family transcriptional regulator
MSTEQEPQRRRTQRRYDWLAILDYIDTFQQTEHTSPSQRMIARALQISAPSVVHHAVHGLQRQGLLTIRITRSGWSADLELTPAGHAALAQWRAARAAAEDGGAA